MDEGQGEGPLGRIEQAAVLCENDRVVWVGRDKEAPAGGQVVDGTGVVAVPGLVDCHTHSVWAGSRADEFRRRLGGESYTAILEAGGGILSTVRATRSAEEEELIRLAAARLSDGLSLGVTTVEVKSGYGLSPAEEARMLRVAKQAGERANVRVMTTFLGAHAVPEEFRGNREAYVRQVIDEQLPAVADVADFIDAYVDRGAFTVEEGRAILSAGGRMGLGIRVHAEQVAFTGAAAMAAELGALSADHLEQIDDVGIAAMARHNTVAVLLPGAMLYLRDKSPPVERLRQAGVPMAIATDLNPGSSPVTDLWTCATLACLTMGMTVEEAMKGITCVGAQALGRTDLGVCSPGALADLALFRPPPGEPAQMAPLIQYLSGRQADTVVVGGRVVLDPAGRLDRVS